MRHSSPGTSVTAHELDLGINTGPIIPQPIFDFLEAWTARNLHFAYMKHGFTLFRAAIDRWVVIEASAATLHSGKGSGYFSKFEIDYSGLKINLHCTADGIIQYLWALSFSEYQIPIIKRMLTDEQSLGLVVAVASAATVLGHGSK
jgi:methionyl-tRNA formyltransferase